MPGDTACKDPDVKGGQQKEAGRLLTMPKLPPVPKRKAPHDGREVRTILDQPVDNNLSPRYVFWAKIECVWGPNISG